jgi:hypothetical protein
MCTRALHYGMSIYVPRPLSSRRPAAPVERLIWCSDDSTHGVPVSTPVTVKHKANNGKVLPGVGRQHFHVDLCECFPHFQRVCAVIHLSKSLCCVSVCCLCVLENLIFRF